MAWAWLYRSNYFTRAQLQFLAATKQLYEWFSPSIHLSVRLSHLFHYVPIIVSSWNFQELLPMTEVRSMQKDKVRGQGSRSLRCKPKFAVFWTITPVWIHIWWWNDAQSFMLLRRGALFFSRSSFKFQGHMAKKNGQFWPKLGVSGLELHFEFTDG